MYDAADHGLRFRLTYGLSRQPSAAELDALLRGTEELFYSAWGLNLEWDTDAVEWSGDFVIHTKTAILAHVLDEARAART